MMLLHSRNAVPEAPLVEAGANGHATNWVEGNGLPTISLIVAVDAVTPGALRSVEDMRRVIAGAPVEIILACRERWDQAPPGARVAVVNSASRGDCFDRAAEQARGEILAFTDTRTRIPKGWPNRILDVFTDPAVAVAGGPVLPRSFSRGERISALLMGRQLGVLPTSQGSRRERARLVRELAGSNLIIRREAFWAVGGFQSPTAGGEAVRLCYKVRVLLEREIRYEPSLAVSATVHAFPRPLLADITSYGRTRGDLARRLRGVAPFFPYGLSILAALVLVAEVALLATRHWTIAAFIGFVVAGAYLAEAGSVVVGRGRFGDRLLAAIALPLVLLVYATAFVRGFLGRSLADVSTAQSSQRPLRVLILNWRDITHHYAGGAETYMHEIARRWAQQGMDVGWLCQRHRGSARVELMDGIRIHRIGGRFTLYPFVAFAYVLWLRKRYDVIVDCENGIPFFTPLFSRLPRVLVVHHVHREIFRRYTRPPVRWLGYWLEGWLMPRVYRNTPVAAVSKSTQDDLIKMGFRPERISVIRSGIAPFEVWPSEQTSNPTILCLGRLTPQKCVDVMIRAMTEVIRELPDARLDIVGQGPERPYLERLAWSLRLAQHVRFHGYVSNGARDEFFARAWVAVCPSRFEGWGVACLEASSRGLPVIAANVAGLRDSVRNGETGILVPHGDTAALAQAVIGLLQDSERRTQLGAAGRQWAAEHSWDESASALRGLLTSGPEVQAVEGSMAVPAPLAEVAKEI
jgi:glycosyltransferase involved in cell wall biosynthesis